MSFFICQWGIIFWLAGDWCKVKGCFCAKTFSFPPSLVSQCIPLFSSAYHLPCCLHVASATPFAFPLKTAINIPSESASLCLSPQLALLLTALKHTYSQLSWTVTRHYWPRLEYKGLHFTLLKKAMQTNKWPNNQKQLWSILWSS